MNDAMVSTDLQLSEQEQSFVDHCRQGVLTDFRSSDLSANRPDLGRFWGQERTIRASVIYALAVGTKRNSRVHALGVRLAGARIEGTLDFSAAELTSPLELTDCYIEEPVRFEGASAHSINLSGSYTNGVAADGLQTKHDVRFEDQFTAHGGVSLRLAQIGGSLRCCGGILRGSHGGLAFDGRGLTVRGSVTMVKGFQSFGPVDLMGAAINGSLDCRGGVFRNAGGVALDGESLTVKGTIFLSYAWDPGRFDVQGEVRLLNARTDCRLDCEGGKFDSAGRQHALYACGISVASSVHMKKIPDKPDGEFGPRCEISGEVSLFGAKIGGDVICDGAVFKALGSSRSAFNASGANIAGGVFFQSDFRAYGPVKFVGAKIDGDLICQDGRFGCENYVVKPHDQCALSLYRARVAGNLNLRFRDIPCGMIDLRSASAGQFTDRRATWPLEGALSLDGFVYERLIDDAPTGVEDRRDWLERQPNTQFKAQPYEQLIRVLRHMGLEKDARELAIAKHDAMRKGLRGLSWLWYWILSITIKYGFAPARVLYFIAFFVAVGSLTFDHAANDCMMGLTKENVYLKEDKAGARLYGCSYAGWKLPEQYPRFNPVMYSLDTLVPVIDLQQKAYWQPIETTLQGASFPWYRTYFWIHTGVGWLLTGVVVAGLSGLVKKD
jgi:hypothetical protein